MEQNKNQSVELGFSNYTYSFNFFYDSYKKLCIDISESIDINKTKGRIYGFIAEFSYAIPSEEKKREFLRRVVTANISINQDDKIQELVSMPSLLRSQEIEYLKLYYRHYAVLLQILGEFTGELTTTLMPNTNIRQKEIRFSNNQMFFDKFTEFKRILMDALSGFTIQDFRIPISLFITYYFAYKMFIAEKDRIYIEAAIEALTVVLLSDEVLSLLARTKLLPEEKKYLIKIESEIHELIMRCHIRMNDSFSSMNVIPKVDKKIAVDRHLI